MLFIPVVGALFAVGLWFGSSIFDDGFLNYLRLTSPNRVGVKLMGAALLSGLFFAASAYAAICLAPVGGG